LTLASFLATFQRSASRISVARKATARSNNAYLQLHGFLYNGSSVSVMLMSLGLASSAFNQLVPFTGAHRSASPRCVSLEVCRMGHRSSHYTLWFVFFGLIAGIAGYINNKQISSEAIWLFVVGVLGIVVTQKWLNEGKFAQAYDFIIGVIFTLVGVVGVLDAFKIHLLSGVSLSAGLVTSSSILGLSITPLLIALVHTVLGLQSINHGLRAGK
jgi:hypothetical protein